MAKTIHKKPYLLKSEAREKERARILNMNASEIMAGVPSGNSMRGQMREILLQVKKHGGYSIFWVTDNSKRAGAATDLVDAGIIGEKSDANYPWCSMRILKT